MHCEFYVMGADGPEMVMRAPLASAQPLNGDQILIEVEEGQVAYMVYDRQFVFSSNPDGGGVTAKMHIQLTRIGVMHKAKLDEPEPEA